MAAGDGDRQECGSDWNARRRNRGHSGRRRGGIACPSPVSLVEDSRVLLLEEKCFRAPPPASRSSQVPSFSSGSSLAHPHLCFLPFLAYFLVLPFFLLFFSMCSSTHLSFGAPAGEKRGGRGRGGEGRTGALRKKRKWRCCFCPTPSSLLPSLTPFLPPAGVLPGRPTSPPTRKLADTSAHQLPTTRACIGREIWCHFLAFAED